MRLATRLLIALLVAGFSIAQVQRLVARKCQHPPPGPASRDHYPKDKAVSHAIKDRLEPRLRSELPNNCRHVTFFQRLVGGNKFLLCAADNTVNKVLDLLPALSAM